jgi:hypothetical protein
LYLVFKRSSHLPQAPIDHWVSEYEVERIPQPHRVYDNFGRYIPYDGAQSLSAKIQEDI